MLFMTVFTYDPHDRNEVIRRRVEQGSLVPKGMELLGEWAHVGSGRVFQLIDVQDTSLLSEATLPWTDIGNLEIYPVADVEKVLPQLNEAIATTVAH